MAQALPLSGESSALIGLILATLGTLATQIIQIWKTSQASKATAEMYRMEAEERRKDAQMLIERTKANAELIAAETAKSVRVLAAKTEENKQELQANMAENKQELKQDLADTIAITKDGTKAAQSAYIEATQVNKCWDEVNAEIRKLAKSMEVLAKGTKQRD